MPSFTEYVHLIADGHEAIAVINKINAAIAKMRHEAASPINVKVQSEFEKAAEGERKNRRERRTSDDAEITALQKKKAEIAAIKAMNKEQGNPSFNVRYGGQESLAQGQRFNDQLAESTRRINRLADAHKHIKSVAKDAGVEVSASLSERLASQVATRTEKSDVQVIREAIAAEKERISAIVERQKQEENGIRRINQMIDERQRQEAEGIKRNNQNIDERQRQEAEGIRRVNQQIDERRNQETEGIKRINQQIDERQRQEAEGIRRVNQDITERQGQEAEGIKRINQQIDERQRQEAEAIRRVNQQIDERQRQESEGVRRVNDMEKERVGLITKRIQEEGEGARRVYQMEQDRLRVEEKKAREERQRLREIERAEQRSRRERETQIASAREGGVRGVAGEFQRDIRRNMIYGAIGQGEALLHKTYEANVERDTAIENVRQAGRSQAQIDLMVENARKLSLQNPTIKATEMLTMQQHNIGAFGNFEEGIANNNLSARYLAIRKGKVGEDEALKENLSILKVGEETGRIRDQGFMKKLYDQQLKIAQAEGAQYDPSSLITSVRMLKSSKFGLSDEAMLNLLPFMGMSEGAARIGNQIAMLSKSMTYAGKSLSKQNLKEIRGTVFSNGTDGYNQEIQTKFAAGDMAGVSAIVDRYLEQKGFDPSNKSNANINLEMQQIAKAIGNTSAREALTAIWANRDQFEKQQRMAAGAQGINVPPLATRTLQGAQDALQAQYSNMSAEVLKASNPILIRAMNGMTVLEQMAAKGASSSSAPVAAGSLGALGIFAALKFAEENPANTALTAATVANTAATAANTAAVGAGGLGKGLLGGAAGAAEGGALLALSRLTAVASVGYAGYEAMQTFEQWWKVRKLKQAAQTPEGIADYNKNTIEDDQRAIKFAQAQADAHAKLMQGQPTPKGMVDIEGQRIAAALKVAIEQLAHDRASPLHFKQAERDRINSDGERVKAPGDERRGRGFGRTYKGSPTFHSGYYHSGEQFGPPQESAADRKDRLFVGPHQDTAQHIFDAKMAESSAKEAISKINSAGTDAAGALSNAAGELKGGASAAAGSITAGGENVAGALNTAAAAISGAAARLGAIGGTPAVAPQSTGQSQRGPR